MREIGGRGENECHVTVLYFCIMVRLFLHRTKVTIKNGHYIWI
jgi:hypothetical protein